MSKFAKKFHETLSSGDLRALYWVFIQIAVTLIFISNQQKSGRAFLTFSLQLMQSFTASYIVRLQLISLCITCPLPPPPQKKKKRKENGGQPQL